MTFLYEFSLPRNIKVKVEEETDGGTLIKEEDAVEMVKLGIAKPTRQQKDQSNFIYAKEFARCINGGVMSKQMLAKAYSNANGLLSKKQEELYTDLYNKFAESQANFQALQQRVLQKEESSEKLAEELKDAADEMTFIYSQLEQFELENQQAFNFTADNMARNKMLLWLTVELSYVQATKDDEVEEGDWVQFFQGNDEDAKFDYYDSLLEGRDEFLKKASDKLALFVSFWYTGRANTVEEFQYLDQAMEALENGGTLNNWQGVAEMPDKPDEDLKSGQTEDKADKAPEPSGDKEILSE